jgi:diguanylate cyclase (GGDEF)-like protein
VFLTTKSPLRDRAGKVINVLTTSLNITERKQAEEHLHHLAHHDPLTGLPNRTYFHDSVRKQIARTRRGDKQFALLLLDLDRFKGVNDVLGHHQGDQLLKAVAQRLSNVVRETDTVARLGGDEFAILQTEIGRTEDAVTLAEKIIKALEQPFELEGQEINTTASVGITVHPTDGVDVDVLLKNADLAMYQAKARRPERLARIRLRYAYQSPVKRSCWKAICVRRWRRSSSCSTISRRSTCAPASIIGAEALLRWRRPGSGSGPAGRIPAARRRKWSHRSDQRVGAVRGLPRRRSYGLRSGLISALPSISRRCSSASRIFAQHVIDVLEKTGLNPQLARTGAYRKHPDAESGIGRKRCPLSTGARASRSRSTISALATHRFPT